MERVNIARSYLESLSSADLSDLADEYGIDIPENLTRRFIIAELLEAASENPVEDTFSACEHTAENRKSCCGFYDDYEDGLELPESYNENKINAVLRNPAWCYVYWDIKKADYTRIVDDPCFSRFLLRISYFPDAADMRTCDTFDISVEHTDREQCIFLSMYAQMISVALMAEFQDNTLFELARSKPVLLPYKHPDISSLSLYREFLPIFTLSGLPDLIRFQYNEHRQSFSLNT